MSRYIDADALIRYGKCGTLVYWEDIEEAPSIKTKEVKYFDEDEKVWKIGILIDEEERYE